MDLCRPTISISWLRSEGRIGASRNGLTRTSGSRRVSGDAKNYCGHAPTNGIVVGALRRLEHNTASLRAQRRFHGGG